jgi:16S rRNA (guanine527-N7)-methyltransferase
LPDRRSQTDFATAREILVSGTVSLGIQLSSNQVDSFLSYLSLLFQWGRKFNLTSIKEPGLVVRRHFLDSLAILPFLSSTGRLLDIGSGAGFPGLPLKIVLPEKEVVLVESHRKKSNFLRELTRKLNIKGVQIIEKRVEELKTNEVGSFDEVVTRAFGSVDLFLKLSFPLLSNEGRSLIMHGPKGVELFRRLKRAAVDFGFSEARLEEVRLPMGDEQRRILIFLKR